jgi:1,4-dihydroxy-2-naphthoate octaprenyltransferase
VLRLAAILSGLVFCNVCLFDLGDRQADARCDVRTIPVRLGTTRTRVLCLSVCAAMLVALSASFGPGLHPDPALWLAILATAGCFALPQPGAALLADGIPVSLGLLVLLGG